MSGLKSILTALAALMTALPAAAEGGSGKLDFFAGLDFNYKDITFYRQYDLLVNVKPGLRYSFAGGWTFSGEALIPVINDYGGYYGKVRPGIVTLSKESLVGQRLWLRASAGLFSCERYGLDLKGFYPVNDWFALEGQLGLTGYGSFNAEPRFSYPRRVTGVIGGDIYLSSCAVQMRGTAGKYAYGDYGAVGELYRHFEHSSIGLYGQWTDLGGINGGYRFLVDLPPYKRSGRKVSLRFADTFRFNYNIEADPYAGKSYLTDPEQSERDEWSMRVTRLGDAMPTKQHKDRIYGSGLMMVQDADMDPAGTARFGSDFLNKNTLPEFGFLYKGEPYHTFDYYMDATLFQWLQLKYTCTERKLRGDGDFGGYGSKDRYFSVKARLLTEDGLRPALALGSDDFATSKTADPEKNGTQYYFGNVWAAATKHFDSRLGRFGATLGYRYFWREYNSKWNGIVGGADLRPAFCRPLRLMAEWDGAGINAGAQLTLLRTVMLRTCLVGMRYFNFGINIIFDLK